MSELELLRQRVEHLEDELHIVYELADKMYAAIYGNFADMIKSAEEYDDWLHAGETVAEDINDL